MKRILLLTLALLILLGCFSACSSSDSSDSEPSGSPSASGSSSSDSSSSDSSSSGSSPSDDAKTGVITVGGSTALQPLLTMAVNQFCEGKEFKGIITINGSNSVQGISDVLAGKINIGNSDISPEQAGIDGAGLIDHQVAIVAVGIVVSSDVAMYLKDISTSDLKGIYTGQITDWEKVVGWKGGSLPIEVHYRKSGSGTRFLFETYGLNASLTDEAFKAFANFKMQDSSGDMYAAIDTGKGAIGYEALPYCPKLKLLTLDGAEATYENVYAGEYKMWGCEHMYTKGEPTGAAKAFIEFLKESDYEETITKNGYGLISEMKVSR